MRIFFDSQIFDLQKYGGISRYFTELMRLLPTVNHNLQIHQGISNTENYYYNDYLNSLVTEPKDKIQIIDSKKKPLYNKISDFARKNRYAYYLYHNLPIPKKRAIINRLLLQKSVDFAENNQKRTIELLKKGDFDIFHPTYYNPYFLEYLGNKKMILTVHDMIHEIFPEHFSLSEQIIEQKRTLLQRADRIIAVSENTKNDIVDIYKISPSKINVIYHGCSFEKDPIYEQSNNNLPKRYVLFVGHRGLYKNFYFFLKAISPILLKDKNLNLVCVGGNSLDCEELAFFDKFNVKDKVLHYFSKDCELNHIYKNAIAFIYPSLYEGFGIPILEAFHAGCPVIMSNTSSLPEVGKDAAIYFEPKKMESIRNAINMVIYDTNLQNSLREKGFERLKHFSWKKAAQLTNYAYKASMVNDAEKYLEYITEND